MSLVLVTAPVQEPVTTAEAKAHMRVDSDSENEFIYSLISTARQVVEKATSRALVTQTWDMYLDSSPSLNTIRVPKPPLQSVTSITTYDTADVAAVLTSAAYRVDATDNQGGRVSLKTGYSWPTALRDTNAFVMRFVAGYGASSAVPPDLKHAIKLLVAHWFENREPVNIGNITTDISLMFEHVIWPYKVFRI